MTAITEDVRGADLPTLMDILNDRQARKIDIVIPASKLKFREGDLVLEGLDHIVEEDGVTDPNGTYQPTKTFDDHLAERLDINPSYLRRLRHGKKHAKTGKLIGVPRLDLYDANANGLLAGRKAKIRPATFAEAQELQGVENIDATGWALDADGSYHRTVREAVAADERSFLARFFRSDETGRGIARGLLSSRFLKLEDLDGALAMLQGIQEAGVDPSTLKISGDLTETRMYIRVMAPEIATWAPELLDGYRSPWDTGTEGAQRKARGRSFEERAALGAKLVAERGWRPNGGGLNYGGNHNFYKPGTEPIIHAGFKMMNSELGNGRWMIVPECTVLSCDNGLTSTTEAFARTHVGSKMDDGHVQWSRNTQIKELELVKSQTTDLVKLALSQDHLEQQVAAMTEKAGKVVADAEKTIEVLGKKLSFTQGEQDVILRHFLMGGQHTAGGVMNAITSASQTLDADAAWEMDKKALAALDTVAAMR